MDPRLAPVQGYAEGGACVAALGSCSRAHSPSRDGRPFGRPMERGRRGQRSRLQVSRGAENLMESSRNLLGQETSPYLLQHAGIPVHWRPWSADALAEAKPLVS